MNRQSENQLNSHDSRWPIAEMLTRGTFRTGTPAERRLILRSRIIRSVMWVWIIAGIVTHMRPRPLMGLVTLFLPASLFTYYAVEKRKYFRTLDELTQRIELEGMAWAYSLGVLAALWVGAVGYAVSLISPLNSQLLSWSPFFLFAAFLAAIKGTYRYFATRRY